MSKIYPYAGFWRRAVAFLIDGIILMIPSMLITGLLLGTQLISFIKLASSATEPDPTVLMPLMGKWMLACVLANILNTVLWWLYHAILESGTYQATWGKRVMGIKVVGVDGGRITFARASGRFFAQIVSAMPLYFGYYMAGFTKHRQALHDLIATTYVVDKNFQEGQELTALPFSKGGLIASILVAIAPVVLYVGTIVLALTLAVSDMKNDPDFWKGANSDTDLETQMSDNRRDLLLITADIELNELAEEHKILPEPFVKEGITYSQSLEGYRATIEAQGKTYELLLRPGEWASCCAKGPGGSCGDEVLYKPCK